MADVRTLLAAFDAADAALRSALDAQASGDPVWADCATPARAKEFAIEAVPGAQSIEDVRAFVAALSP